MKTSLRGFLFRLLISLGSVGLIVFLMRGKLGEALEILKSGVSWHWVAVACLVYLAGLAVIAVRMQYVFRVQQLRVGFWESFYLGFVGLFFNLFFPSAVGGDVAKAYFAYKYTGKKIESMTSVVLDRLIGLVAMTLMAMIALFLYSKELNDPRIDRVIYIFMGVMLVIACFLGSRRFARLFRFAAVLIPSSRFKARLAEVYEAFYGSKDHMSILVLSIVLSLAGQSLFILVNYLLAVSMGIQLKLWIFFVLIPMIAIISMAPSVGGLGVREAGSVYLFSHFISPGSALAFSVLSDILIYGFSLLSGVLFSLKGGLKSKTIHEMEELE